MGTVWLFGKSINERSVIATGSRPAKGRRPFQTQRKIRLNSLSNKMSNEAGHPKSQGRAQQRSPSPEPAGEIACNYGAARKILRNIDLNMN